MNLNHTISLLEVSTFRANRVQDLHQEKRNLCCKYAQNQKNFNLPKQRGLSVKRELGIVTIHHHCHHSITFYLPIGFHTSHLAMLLLPLPGLNCTFLCAAKCSNTKALQSVLLPCPGTGSSNRSFSAAVPTLAPQTTLCWTPVSFTFVYADAKVLCYVGIRSGSQIHSWYHYRDEFGAGAYD